MCWWYVVGHGTQPREDLGARPRDDPASTPLGAMPSAAALAGLPSVDSVVTALPTGVAGGGMAPGPAAALVNLLPMAGPDLKLPVGGAYVGEGLPPVPAKLAGKIRRWEFVEMGELLPEFWTAKEEVERKDQRPRQGRKVTEIFTWLQCYGSLVAVLAPTEPRVIPELMAYMGLIVRVSQDYEGLGWVRYDSAFRRQAALTGNKRWSVINSTLFAMNFSGRASGVKRCELCFATSHSEQECAQRGEADPDMGSWLKTLEGALISLARQTPAGRSQPSSSQPGNEVCRKWNTTGCTFMRCLFRHECSGCGGAHPLAQCRMRGQATGKMSGRPAGRPY